jgi:hypothetical protein
MSQGSIRGVSGLMSWAVPGAAAVLILFYFSHWASAWHGVGLGAVFIDPAVSPRLIYGWELVTLAGLAVPLVLSCLGLWHAHRLFQLYRAGAVFSLAAGGRIRTLGIVLLALPFAQLLTSAAVSVIVTSGNASGARQLSLTLAPSDVVLGLTGALLIVVGWVLAEAARLADDHSQIV